MGLPGAVLMGLGSIVGTGVFISLGIAAGIAGGWLLLAIPLAAVVAACNGLSSAQLAASHPLSGGTYAYGRRYLGPAAGFAAGLLFLAAKSASAATAALGLAGYLLGFFGETDVRWRIVVGLLAVAMLTVLVAGGIRRSNRFNAVIVSFTMLAFAAFLLAGVPAAVAALAELGGIVASAVRGSVAGVPAALEATAASGDGALDLRALLHAAALVFVAFTGYGRIATLGEEVREPATTIPRAIIVALAVVVLLYAGVAAVALGSVGAPAFAEATARSAAPLEVVARVIGGAWLAGLIALAAVTAMLGVLLNLVLGLSRVAFAMARARDLPGALGRVAPTTGSPVPAVIATGAVIAALVLIGDVRVTWSFSAFTVLSYYAITNLAALRLAPRDRLYPRWVPAVGLAGCLGLAFQVEAAIWIWGIALLAAGFAARAVAHRLAR